MPRLLLSKLPPLKLYNIISKQQNLNVLRYFGAVSATKETSSLLDDKSLWVPSNHADIPLIEGVTLPEYLRANMGNWGNAIAYECGVTGRKYTHNEVYRMGRSFAAALINSKQFQPGDVIGIVLQNVPEFSSVLFGIWDAGLIASPVNPSYTDEEIKRQLAHSDSKGVITTPDYLKAVLNAKNSKECSALKSVIVIGEPVNGCHNFYDMVKTDTAGVEFFNGSKFNTKQQTCLLPFSSGTTGNPKGVELTHYNMVSNVLQISGKDITNIKTFADGHDQERFIGLLPMFHIYGLAVFCSTALLKGSHVLCLPKFAPETFLKAIRQLKPTTLHLVTPLINHIVNSKDFGKNELSEVTTIVGGAAPIGPTLIYKLLEKASKKFVFQEGYGMTELSPVSHILVPAAGLSKVGSCGGAVPNTITKIVDVSTGETLGRNQRGEICVKGPQVMKGYYKNETATRDCLDENGWLRTGDIGYYDSDQYLFIVDRLKELIKVKGFQVAPSELEDLLREHPDVSDVAVIGIPDDKWGELPRASIVRKNKNLSAEDLNSYLKDKVASYKQLRGGIDFVEAIPKAPSGKILRREILQTYKKENGLD